MDKLNLDKVIRISTGAPLLDYKQFIKLSLEDKKEYIQTIYTNLIRNGITMKIGFTNEKGGTGKTFISVNVAYLVSQLGIDVLVIDGDPQASLTMEVGANLDPKDNEAFKKIIDTIPEVEEIYKDLNAFKPRPLTEINIREEFNLPPKLSGIVPLMEKMFIKREPLTKDDFEGIILQPKVYLPNKKKKRRDSSIIYEDELIPYGFDLIPSSSELAHYGLNAIIENSRGKGYHLAAAMKKLLEYEKEVHNKVYGLTICDLPPSVESVSLNDMTYCEDGVIGVITPNQEVINGIYNIMETIQSVMLSLDKNITGNEIHHVGIPAIVLNKCSNTKMSKWLTPEYIRKKFQTRSPKSRISLQNRVVQSAHNEHMLATQYEEKVYNEFEELTLELLYLILLSRIETNERTLSN